MKKFLLFSFVVVFGLAVSAQKFGHVPAHLKNVPATRSLQAVENTMNLINATSPYVAVPSGKAINEEQIGTTQYDLQSNSAVQNRIYLFSDGTIGATFTYGITATAFGDRGTGYNYYDGAAWGADPTVRIESVRTGWPSYSPLGAGELALTHDGSNGLQVTSRTAKGTGSWSATTLAGPMTSNGGGPALLWPRSITVGNTIHVIACTDQAAAGSTMANMYYYQGLSLALVYYNSTDGGATWSAPIVIPGMDSAAVRKTYNTLGFGGDSYSWAAPRGDTIAFVVGDSWSDFFAMKSFDGGTTWTKVMIYQFPNLTVAPTPIIATVDGASAIAIDANGKVHVVVGKMRVSDDDFSDDPPATSYYPYTDGLLYWNENMSEFDSALLNDDATLFANGQLISMMLDYTGNDTIDFPVVGSGEWPFGNYYLSLTSMPQIIIDDNNDIYVTYSSCREDKTNPGASPNEQLYRDLYGMVSTDGGATWQDPLDLVDNALHAFDECVFGSLSYTSDTKLHIVYQCDEEPGLAVRGDEDTYGTNYIYYLGVDKPDFIMGVTENVSNTDISIYPNPAADYTVISLNMQQAQNVKVSVVNMIGQSVFAKNYGSMAAGQHNLTINTSDYNSGLYLVSIESGDSKVTRKLIVE